MADILTVRDLAKRTGEAVSRLRQWHKLGLIGAAGGEEYAPPDVERIRLIQLLLRRGISLDVISRSEKGHGFLARYMQSIFPAGVTASQSLAEAAEVVGMDLRTVRRFADVLGLGDDRDALNPDDVQTLRGFKVALDAGFPEEAMVQLGRVYNDALSRVAEAEQRLFHFYVHDRLKEQGLAGQALVDAAGESRDRIMPLIEPAILYFHRKGWQRAVREDAVLHLQEEMGLIGTGSLRGQLQKAIVFVDLSSFTPLGDAMGDQAAAQVLERFSLLVRERVNRWEGQVVKQIGDAFMLVFPEPRSAVACTVEIDDRAAEEPHFPAVRSAVHWGPVLYREGDYVGTNVNVAARLAAEAQRHQVLVTAAVRTEAGFLEAAEFVPIGKRQLKGLAEAFEVFEVVRRKATRAPRLVDPVCGMELDAAEVAARLSLEGEERAFCSQQCLQRFVAAPQRYGNSGRRP
jgi:class 3 adenylate cyclase/YHS domain-containing protein